MVLSIGMNHSLYVRCKDIKAAHKLPEDFAEIKLAFLQRLKSEFETWSILHALIIKGDQTTGSKLVPVSQWIMVGKI